MGTIAIAATTAAMPSNACGRIRRRRAARGGGEVGVGHGAAVGHRQSALAQRRGRVGQRAGLRQHPCDALELRFELVAHRVRSRYSARRASPLRVRVLTVPSGRSRRSAISLCVSPSL